MIDALQRIDREELTSGWFFINVEGWEALRSEYERHGRSVPTPEDLAAELKPACMNGLAAASPIQRIMN